ncbi:MAG: cytoplasmic protein [bacterium]|nr:cytoplasmic protein [bacterium]
MHQDPTVTDSDKYKVVFENDKVRVLEYKDKPGGKTNLHHHPNSVMYFLSSFKRQIAANGKTVTVDGKKGTVTWLKAQDHVGENIGDTDTHVLLVELKESGNYDQQDQGVLGPEKIANIL